MPKYNPKNKQHRKTLATRISKMLLGNGFLTTMEYGWITYDVYQFEGSRKIDVFTNIWMDEVEKTAIAIGIQSELDRINVPLKGDMDGITSRLLRAIQKMKKASAKRERLQETLLDLDFKVGDLILHSSMNHDNGENWKGMCKAVNAGLITVFWFHSGKTIEFPALNLRHLKAA